MSSVLIFIGGVILCDNNHEIIGAILVLIAIFGGDKKNDD